MGAKHRMTGSLKRPRSLGVAAPISLLCAASFAALAITGIDIENSSAPSHMISEEAHESAPQPVSQEGILIAVSADSVTARSASGYTQTYLLTPDTTVITGNGSKPLTVTSHFTVNDAVDIVGTVQGNKALATSLAHRNVAHGDGPPMDAVAGQ
ncbi:hypothetical protein [Mycobacterium sp. Aquia_213]|uniref:hypothetical protein n=1 Tax=Mycobacterium sp. Aquia_213 TaxID=2991728 RepID=UPI0022711367|nr:hypothetical protein [Mycobacterium sp. Aquia_213]WAC92212.1 hypothetical protein LMQ14_03105 [Mycobacterium sp. Aquia_213]